jgi:hypothetical protein
MMVVVVFDDDEVFFCNHEVFAVDLVEDVWLEHVGRRTGSVQASFQ